MLAHVLEGGHDAGLVVGRADDAQAHAPNEACKTFNMGVGLCIICSADDEGGHDAGLENMGEHPFRVGTCIEGTGEVKYTDEQ